MVSLNLDSISVAISTTTYFVLKYSTWYLYTTGIYGEWFNLGWTIVKRCNEMIRISGENNTRT